MKRVLKKPETHPISRRVSQTMLAAHLEHMRTAVRLARYALDHGETPVACVLVDDADADDADTPGHVVAWGINDTNRSLSGTAHAEFQAVGRLQQRLPRAWQHVLRTCTLYVTVEPCVMCASALRQLGVRRVVFGCANERFGGNGTVLAVQRGRSTPGPAVLVTPGVLRREAVLLLRYFYVRANARAPRPRSKHDRQLDRSTFPPMAWDRYLSRGQFAADLGPEHLAAFDSQRDLVGPVEWPLVDEPCDDEKVVTCLDVRCDEYALRFQNKRVKR